VTALIFVPLLALTAMVVGAVWCYVAHTFVHIVEETSAGNDEVRRSEEPLTDWLWQSGYIASFVFLWGAPAYLLGRLTSQRAHGDWKPVVFALTIASVLWIFFPISFLSSMSIEAGWTPFAPGLILRLLRRVIDTAIYFALTGLIIGACGLLAPFFVAESRFWLLFPAGIVFGLAVVLYSRLTGRMAHVARLASAERKKKRKPKLKRPRGTKVVDPWEVPDEVLREEEEQGTGFIQPSDMPTITGVLDEEISGYDVSFKNATVDPSTSTDVKAENRTSIPDDDCISSRRSNRNEALGLRRTSSPTNWS